jgi:hypothetical protein
VGSREWNSTEARKVIEMLLAPGMAD